MMTNLLRAAYVRLIYWLMDAQVWVWCPLCW